MESTQNKIYEIEESAIIDQNIKSSTDEDIIYETKNGRPFLGGSSLTQLL